MADGERSRVFAELHVVLASAADRDRRAPNDLCVVTAAARKRAVLRLTRAPAFAHEIGRICELSPADGHVLSVIAVLVGAFVGAKLLGAVALAEVVHAIGVFLGLGGDERIPDNHGDLGVGPRLIKIGPSIDRRPNHIVLMNDLLTESAFTIAA